MTRTDAVCLPDQDHHIGPDDQISINECFIAGWGHDQSDIGSEKLLSAAVNIFSTDYCESNRRRFLGCTALSPGFSALGWNKLLGIFWKTIEQK